MICLFDEKIPHKLLPAIFIGAFFSRTKFEKNLDKNKSFFFVVFCMNVFVLISARYSNRLIYSKIKNTEKRKN